MLQAAAAKRIKLVRTESVFKAGFVCIDENIQQEDPAGGVAASRMLFDQLSESWDITELSALLSDVYAKRAGPRGSKDIIRAHSFLISDFDLLKLLLNIKILPGDMMLQFAMSFWIRHRLVQLFLNQYYALVDDEEKEKMKRMATLCKISADDFRKNTIEKATQGCYALFSARGIHLYHDNDGLCHFADVYDEFRCTQPAASGKLYCEKHNRHAVYDPESEDRLSKLFRYYGSFENFEQADEKDLQRQLNSFLNKLTHYFTSLPDETEIQQALDFYHYSDRSELVKSALAGLRKKFADYAFRSHPDQTEVNEKDRAVSSVDWNKAHEYYRVLRRLLEKNR